MKNRYLRCYRTLLLSALISTGIEADAQTALSSGDIVFTSFYSSSTNPSPDEFSFLLLTPISSGTKINFTDIGYNGITATMPTSVTLDATISWTCASAIPALKEVHIIGLAATIGGIANGTVTCVENNGYGLPLSTGGDCILAYQANTVPSASPTFIAGIQMNYETGPPASTASTWDQLGVAPANYVYSSNRSSLPPGINSANSMWLNVEFDNGKFNCNVLPQPSISALRTAILNSANWTFNDVAQSTGWGEAGCSNWVVAPPTLAKSSTNVSCFGGSNGTATVTVSGGTAPFYYSWSPSGGTAATATGLAAGIYTVTVTDANSTQASTNVTITQPPALNASTVVISVACYGGSNGSINLTPSGGTSPYTFNWGGGVTTEDRTGLTAGTYSVVITDLNGCTRTVNNIVVTQPSSAVSGTRVVTNVSCFGGSNGTINLTPSGGTGPYTFNWGSAITTEDRTGLAAGSYSVVITDSYGCTGTVNAVVVQPAAPVGGSTTVTNVSCFGGTNGAINLTPSGGTPGYTYNWGSGIVTEDRTSLAAGSYTVIITDANGCTGTLNPSVIQPSALTTGVSANNASCANSNNGSATISASGGTSPYTYTWSPAGGTSATAINLSSGSYTATLTDANGCTKNQSVVIGSSGSTQTGGVAGTPGSMSSQNQPVENASGNYTDGNCNRITKVIPSGANPVSGSVTTKVWVENTVPTYANVPYVSRHYEIMPASNAATATATVTLYYLQSEFTDFNAANSSLKLPTGPSDASGIANIRIAKYSGTSSDNSGKVGTYSGSGIIIDPADNNIVWNASEGRWEVTFNVSGFSGFILQTQQSILPITLTSFTAARSEGKVEIKWVTAAEQNTDHFVIERSAGGQTFDAIGKTTAAGSSSSVKQYRYVDAQPLSLGYYRLKTVDRNGIVAFSATALVRMDGKGGLRVLPNPAINIITVEGLSGNKSEIGIYDATGHCVQKVPAMAVPSLKIDVSALAPGPYYLQAGNQSVKFTKL